MSSASDPSRGKRLDGLPERVPELRVVGLEADLGRLEGVDETGMVLGGNVILEPALDGGDEPHQLGPVLVALPGALDGGRQLVQKSSQVVFHASNAISPVDHALAGHHCPRDRAGDAVALTAALESMTAVPLSVSCQLRRCGPNVQR